MGSIGTLNLNVFNGAKPECDLGEAVVNKLCGVFLCGVLTRAVSCPSPSLSVVWPGQIRSCWAAAVDSPDLMSPPHSADTHSTKSYGVNPSHTSSGMGWVWLKILFFDFLLPPFCFHHSCFDELFFTDNTRPWPVNRGFGSSPLQAVQNSSVLYCEYSIEHILPV